MDSRAALWRDGHRFTSNIVWCEEKYAYSTKIAEFWNTLSNAPFMLLALYYLVMGSQLGLKVRYYVIYLFLLLVGIGSAAFHAALSYEAQLLDELPMMLLVGQAIWCLYADAGKQVVGTGSGKKITLAAIVYGAIALGTLIYVLWNRFYVFHILFSLLTLVCVIGGLYRCRQRAEASGPMLLALLLSILAFVLWILDSLACSALRQQRLRLSIPWKALLQLHAWWHLLTSLAVAWFVGGLIISDSTSELKIVSRFIFFPCILRDPNKWTSKGAH